MPTHNLKYIAFVFFCAVLFLTISLTDLHLPHIVPDGEALHITPAICMTLNKCERFEGSKIGDFHLPILGAWHHGVLEGYLLYPFIKLFGLNTNVLYLCRSIAIILTLAAGLMFAYLAYQMFDLHTSMVAIVLILFNLTFLLSGRIGLQYVEMTMFWFLQALVFNFVYKWTSSRRSQWLYLAAFFTGVGIYGKLNFLWIAAGIFIGWHFSLKHSFSLRIRKTQYLGMFFATLLGVFPLIWANIWNKGVTIRHGMELLISPTAGLSNVYYFKNLLIILSQFKELLTGDLLMIFSYPRFSHPIVGVKYLPLIALGLLCIPRFRDCWIEKRAQISFLLIYIIVFLFSTAINGRGLAECHIFILLPVSIICLAVVLRIILKNKVILMLATALIVIPALLRIPGYHKCQEKNPMVHVKKNLAAYLLNKEIHDPIIFTPNIDWSLIVLSGGKVFPICMDLENTGAEYDEFARQCLRLLNDPNKIYIYGRPVDRLRRHHRNGEILFEKVVKEQGKQLVVLQDFKDKKGSLRYRLYQAVPFNESK